MNPINLETDEEYLSMQEIMTLNKELLRIYRHRLTRLGLTDEQIDLRMAPLLSRSNQLHDDLARLMRA